MVIFQTQVNATMQLLQSGEQLLAVCFPKQRRDLFNPPVPCKGLLSPWQLPSHPTAHPLTSVLSQLTQLSLGFDPYLKKYHQHWKLHPVAHLHKIKGILVAAIRSLRNCD